jgi:hypothetical protein
MPRQPLGSTRRSTPALRWRAAPRIEEQLVEVAEAGRGADFQSPF